MTLAVLTAKGAEDWRDYLPLLEDKEMIVRIRGRMWHIFAVWPMVIGAGWFARRCPKHALYRWWALGPVRVRRFKTGAEIHASFASGRCECDASDAPPTP